MKNYIKLQEEIEYARKKLDDAIGNGADQQIYYMLSIELDQLIEEYIQLEEEKQVAYYH